MNFRFEYPDNIKNLAIYCQKIYDPRIATDRVSSNIKLANSKVANTPTSLVPPLFQTTSTSRSIFYPILKNTLSPLLNKKWLKLIKKGKYFYF